MKLIDVYDTRYDSDDVLAILWNLLLEREEHVNISHKKMPSFPEHVDFVASIPYKEWYLIINDMDIAVGACYLSKRNEIGVHVFHRHRGNGYGSFAVHSLMLRHADERLLANINPRNTESRAMFEHLGFRHIQDTLELMPRPNMIRREEQLVREPTVA